MVIIEKGKILSCGALGEITADRTNTECRVLLTFPSAAAGFIAKMKTLSLAQTVEVHSPRQLQITLASEEQFPAAMAKIFQSGLPVIAMSRPDVGLEGVFMDKTSGEVQ